MGNDTERNWLDEVYVAETREELAGLYDGWASEYENDLRRFGDNTTTVVTALAARHIDPRGGPVLDAGVGTGRIGGLLSILGYRDLVGIDVSKGMLAQAAGKGVYSELREMALGGPLDFPDGHFAGIVCAGVLTLGHAPPDALDELIRITRPGGRMVFSISTPAFVNCGFKEKLASLDTSGRWRKVQVTDEYVGLPRARKEPVSARVYVYGVP